MQDFFLEDEYLIPLYAKRGLCFTHGEGIYLYDQDGKKYIDFMTHYGVNILGHAHPSIIEALSRQVKKMSNSHMSFYSDVRGRFLQKLVEVTNSDSLNKVFFSNSGTESVEAALKFARVASKRSGVVAAKWGYHGRTFGSLAATGSKKYQKPYKPMLEHFSHVPYGDADLLNEAIDENVGAVILEPIQGEAGIHVSTRQYMQEVRKICNEKNVILVFDEVQTAFRTGNWFAWQDMGIEPDIFAVSKGVANGFPMAVTVVTKQISEMIPKGTHGNTFGGNPMSCAVALETFRLIENERLLESSREVGSYFKECLFELSSPLIREVRGKGLMVAVELKQKVSKYAKRLQEAGVITIPTGATTLRFLPPIIVSKEDIDEVITILKDVLSA